MEVLSDVCASLIHLGGGGGGVVFSLKKREMNFTSILSGKLITGFLPITV